MSRRGNSPKSVAGRLSQSYTRQLSRFRYGAGVFKIDYALHHPIPWTARECSQSATVHIGGTFDEIAASEAAVRAGQHAARPFVLLAQPSLFDDSRAPIGQHTAWAYCHVPNGSNVSALESIENQIERFAPGFRDCILARRVFAPDDLEAMDANLVGGDVGGGAMDVQQFLFRPTGRGYATSAKRHLHLLGLDAARRRRARHVRLSCSDDGARTTEELVAPTGFEPVLPP